MDIVTLTATAAGLAMDAFAVSVCKGLAMQNLSYKKAVIIGLWFGIFQAIMPFIGFTLGMRFEYIIDRYADWVAFILLALIGANMIKEGVSGDEESVDDSVKFKNMLVLAVATSIDALAVGVSFACIRMENIFISVAIIGVITFIFSVVGVKIGNTFGSRYKNKAEIAGGIILIIIALKIIIEHYIG